MNYDCTLAEPTQTSSAAESLVFFADPLHDPISSAMPRCHTAGGCGAVVVARSGAISTTNCDAGYA
eukprot:SAG11_NODE_985_length_6288_cov_53.468972_7_plen_66_part_00